MSIKLSPLSLSTGLISAVMFLPILALLYEAFSSVLSVGPEVADDAFKNIAETVLLDYIINSFLIVTVTLLFACLFSLAPAWWCAQYEFKGRRWLQWLMVFPLAIPAYISAYIYTDLLDYAGPIQSWLRSVFGWQSPADYWFVDMRTITGASFVLALALYPYLYLLLRNNFAKQSNHLAQASSLLGATRYRTFWRIRFPLARPALAIGCTLIAMETLADFGTVHLFAINTLTTAIYDSWLVYGSLSAAAKISCILLFAVVSLVYLERLQRRRQRHYELNGHHRPKRHAATARQTVFIWLVCALIIALGFVLPVVTLLNYTLQYWEINWQQDLFAHIQNTFLLAATAAAIATIFALLLNVNQRFHPSQHNKAKLAVSSVGYAIPGTVLAIGVLIPLGALDIGLNRWLDSLNWQRVGLIFSGTSFALVLAFVIRFAAIANGSVSSTYAQLPINLDHASRMLHAGRLTTFRKIHIPLLTPAMMSAFLLVFIECVKELSASLLLRPFDFQTLATYTYQYASDEQLEQGALSALLIIIVSILPLLFLSKTQKLD